MNITPINERSLDDLGHLLCGTKASRGCWCMWFIVPVKDYHQAGDRGNRASFSQLVETSRYPLGLLAKMDGETVGWCAVGPRSRYVRAIRTPTYKGRDPAEDDDVWLVPCMYIRPESRDTGIAKKLLEAAVRLARKGKAVAIEGFPYSGTTRRNKETQVGFEPVFSDCGFLPTRRHSSTRVVMRLEL